MGLLDANAKLLFWNRNELEIDNERGMINKYLAKFLLADLDFDLIKNPFL
jgi:hypothetical protein